MTNSTTFEIAVKADAALSAALQAQFGKRAGDARYGSYHAMNDRVLSAFEVYFAACQQNALAHHDESYAADYQRRIDEIRAVRAWRAKPGQVRP